MTCFSHNNKKKQDRTCYGGARLKVRCIVKAYNSVYTFPLNKTLKLGNIELDQNQTKTSKRPLKNHMFQIIF